MRNVCIAQGTWIRQMAKECAQMSKSHPGQWWHLSAISSCDGGTSPGQIGKWLPLALLDAVRSLFSQLFLNSLHGKGTVDNLHKQRVE